DLVARQFVKLGHKRRRKTAFLRGCQTVGELLGTACPDDGRCDRRIGQDPRNGKRDHAHACVSRDFAYALHGGELLIVPVARLVARTGVAQRKAGSLGWRCVPVMFAAEQAACQWIVGVTAIPSSSHSGNRSRSKVRNRRLYRGCTESMRQRFLSSVRPKARATRYAGQLETPI